MRYKIPRLKENAEKDFNANNRKSNANIRQLNPKLLAKISVICPVARQGLAKISVQTGQALLELSIFGSIILMLLGLLISYGLRYNFQQEAQMDAYRKALEIAAQKGSGSYTLIKDQHIPSIESPYGVGGVQPFMASASVIRDSQADATADDYEGLPKMIIHLEGRVNGQVTGPRDVELATAGIRKETVKLPDRDDDFGITWEEAWKSFKKYIFGKYGQAVKALYEEEWEKTYQAYTDLKEKYSIVYGNVSGWPSGTDVNDGVTYKDYYKDGHESVKLTIVDYCEGEVVDYNSAIRQARLIVDNDFCQRQCELGKSSDSEINCQRACGYGIKVPWYAQGAYRNDSPYIFTSLTSFAGEYDTTDSWEFPNIENLFVLPVTGKKVQSMGLQPDYTQQITTDFSMQKTEDDQFIATKDNVYWDTTTTRTLLYNDHLDKDLFDAQGNLIHDGTGMPRMPTNLETEDYSTTRSETETTTWETNIDY